MGLGGWVGGRVVIFLQSTFAMEIEYDLRWVLTPIVRWRKSEFKRLAAQCRSTLVVCIKKRSGDHFVEYLDAKREISPSTTLVLISSLPARWVTTAATVMRQSHFQTSPLTQLVCKPRSLQCMEESIDQFVATGMPTKLEARGAADVCEK